MGIQWPTDEHIEKFGLEAHFVHCFCKKISVEKLINNKELYHYSLSKKLPHLKVYVRFSKTEQIISHLIVTSQNLHGNSKNFEFGVVLKCVNGERMSFMPRRYCKKDK